jgi:hypothetical protein
LNPAASKLAAQPAPVGMTTNANRPTTKRAHRLMTETMPPSRQTGQAAAGGESVTRAVRFSYRDGGAPET